MTAPRTPLPIIGYSINTEGWWSTYAADLKAEAYADARALAAKLGRSVQVEVTRGLSEEDYYDEQEIEGPTCSICDGLGHGYPGGRPCPLEDRGW